MLLTKLLLFLFFTLLFFSNSALLANSYQRLDEIQTKLQKNSTQLKKKKQTQKNIEKSIGVIKKKIKISEIKHDKLVKSYKKTLTSQKKTKERLSQISSRNEQLQSQLSKRINFIFKYQDAGFLDLLFAAKEFDLLAPVVFSKILEQDKKLIIETQQQQQQLLTVQKQYFQEGERLKSLKKQLLNNEKYYLNQKKTKEKYYQSLSGQIKKLQAQNKALLASSEEITRLLSRRSKRRRGYYGTGTFIKPVKGWLSSKFGPRKHPLFKRHINHNGIDFAAPKGRKIKAADSGYILVAGQKQKYKGYGNITIIDHGERKEDGKRVSTIYAHQSRIMVRQGDFVKKGDVIGWVGDTGYATGPHLHFELRLNGVPVNPLPYVK